MKFRAARPGPRFRAAAGILCCGIIAAGHAHSEGAGSGAPVTDAATLGRSIFFANWVPIGASGEHVGLGPLFNATSCNACHEGGYGGQGPSSDGRAPVALVIHLDSKDRHPQERGDPTYGRIFNTAATACVRPEGSVRVSYTELAGYYYPFGPRWVLRAPHYHLEDLAYGPLAASTVIKPRIAPALFGVGVLETMTRGTPAGRASSQEAADVPASGHLGWQADEATIRDQTTVAMAFDMGITSGEQPRDDCTTRQLCRRSETTEAPEMPSEILDALVEFERTLPVPAALREDARGSRVFNLVGCAACHRDGSVKDPAANEGRLANPVAYTDLRVHDLGPHMADENAAGQTVRTLWRTAPLWGMAHRLQHNPAATFLHDGRARTTEEAILWHGGEAAKATRAFAQLGSKDRALLLEWIDTR